MRSKIELAAEDMPDRAVDGQPEIKAILESLEALRPVHAAAVTAVQDAERQIAEFRAMAEHHQRKIIEFEELQTGVAEGYVLGDDEAQKKWAEADQGIEAASRFLRAHKLALPRLEAWARPSPSIVANLASRINRLEMDLADARREAKLEVARVELSA